MATVIVTNSVEVFVNSSLTTVETWRAEFMDELRGSNPADLDRMGEVCRRFAASGHALLADIHLGTAAFSGDERLALWFHAMCDLGATTAGNTAEWAFRGCVACVEEKYRWLLDECLTRELPRL
jgi:hypothetical protein